MKHIALLMFASLALTGCGSPSDKTAEFLLKGGRYTAQAEDIEKRAHDDLDMSGIRLVSLCIDAAMKDAQIKPEDMPKIRELLAHPSNGNTPIDTLALGVNNLMDRCVTFPKAYNIGK